LVESLAAEPGVNLVGAPDLVNDRRVQIAAGLRSLLDFVHFMEPRFNRSYRARAKARVPLRARPLMARPFVRTRLGRSVMGALLKLAQRIVPASPTILRFLAAARPDVILSTPYIALRTAQPDVHRAAAKLGIPTAVGVASWDNLTSKSIIRPVPDRVFVWNETQKLEATELHGVPVERVVVTGAQCFDEWLTWEPRPREEFCERLGFDQSRPFLLYTCFTPFKRGPSEVEFVLTWLRHLRSSKDPVVAGVGVVVRPHPKRVREWAEVDLSQFGDATVWPYEPRWPTDRSSKADYFDSIYHSAAVVGINTSAMLEAGLIGRPVLTILAHEYWDSQEGTLHFRYLREVGGGLIREARSLEQHEQQLKAILGRQAGEASAEAFVRSFLRPHGIDVPATPIFVEAVEQLAAAGPARRRLGARPGRARHALVSARSRS
jgi:hypothetical protein